MSELTPLDLLGLPEEKKGLMLAVTRQRVRYTSEFIELFGPTTSLGADGETLEAVLEQAKADLQLLLP